MSVRKVIKAISFNCFQHVKRFCTLVTHPQTMKNVFSILKSNRVCSMFWILQSICGCEAEFSCEWYDDHRIWSIGHIQAFNMRNKRTRSRLKISALCDPNYKCYAFSHSNGQPCRVCGAYRRQLCHYWAVYSATIRGEVHITLLNRLVGVRIAIHISDGSGRAKMKY